MTDLSNRDEKLSIFLKNLTMPVKIEDRTKGSSRIVAVPEINEKEILRALRHREQDAESPSTIVDKFMALIAERILILGIKNGEPLVLPTSSLLLRNHKAHKPEKGDEEGTLSNLYERLYNENDPNKQMEIGLKLGDRGTHAAAGIFPGSRRKAFCLMGDQELERYAGRLAMTGYGSALRVAEKGRGGRDMLATVIASVPQLVQRYRDVLKIIQSLKEQIKITTEDQWLEN